MASKPKKGTSSQRREAYTRVVFPQYTDQELAGVNFRIDDPLGLPNRSEEEPPRDQTITFVGFYEQGRTIKCVFGHAHRAGFAFRDEIGRHYLVGGTCGVNVMGVQEWQEVVGQYRDLRSRSDYLRQMRALREALDKHHEWLDGLSAHPAIAALNAVRGALVKRRDLYQDAHAAIRYRGGQVHTSQEQRDHDEEERRETREEIEIARFGKLKELDKIAYLRHRREPKVTTTPIIRRIPVPLGSLAGQVLFLRPAAEPKAIKQVVAELRRLTVTDTMLIQTADLKKRSKEIRVFLDGLNQIRDDIVDAISFFDQNNIERVASWANDKRLDGATYRALPGRLQIVNEETGLELSIERPRELQPIDDPVFAELQEARSAFSRVIDR